MNEIYLKIIRFFIGFFTIILVSFLILKSGVLTQIFPIKEVQKGKQELKEKVKELQKEIEPFYPRRGEKVEKLPESGLKLSFEIRSKNTPPNALFFDALINGNEAYLKLKSEKFPENLKFFNFLFQWQKIEVKENEVEELKKLKEVLEKRGIFKKFEKKNGEYEFEIDKEKLKNGILEWKKEIPQENLENFLQDQDKISGKIFLNEENLIKGVELENKDVKIIMRVESLNGKVLEGENLEKLLVSILKIY